MADGAISWLADALRHISVCGELQSGLGLLLCAWCGARFEGTGFCELHTPSYVPGLPMCMASGTDLRMMMLYLT